MSTASAESDKLREARSVALNTKEVALGEAERAGKKHPLAIGRSLIISPLIVGSPAYGPMLHSEPNFQPIPPVTLNSSQWGVWQVATLVGYGAAGSGTVARGTYAGKEPPTIIFVYPSTSANNARCRVRI